MSSKRNQTAEPVTVPGKRTKADISPCDIKTAELFHDNYTSHKISKTKNTFKCVSGWDSLEGRSQIEAWLRVVSADQVRMYGRIRRNSEAALYPLIITTLLPVFDLCDCIASGNVARDIPHDDLEHVAAEIAESQSRKSSRHTSTEKTGPSTETDDRTTKSDSNADEDDLPDTVNTSSESEVLKFMIYIEKWLQSSQYATKGRVEIMIMDSETGKTVAVIEAKPHISNNDPDNAGFFQCCAYMALQNIPFGIFTDHKTFQFVRMDKSHTMHYSKLFDLMQSEYDALNPNATAVYAHLFEVMGVPRSTDLLASAAASATSWAQRAVVLNAEL